MKWLKDRNLKEEFGVMKEKLYNSNIAYTEDYFNYLTHDFQITYNPVKYTFGIEIERQLDAPYETIKFGLTFIELCYILDTYRK